MVRVISLALWGVIFEENPKYVEKRNNYIATKVGSNPLLVRDVIDEVLKEFKQISDRTGLYFNRKYLFSCILTKLGATPYNTIVDDIITKNDSLFLEFYPTMTSEAWHEFLPQWKETRQIYCLEDTGLIDSKIIRTAMHLDNTKIFTYFNGSVFSDELNFTKSDIRFYKTILDLSNNAPNDVLHIGKDFYTDMEVPKLIGIKTKQFDINNIKI